MTTNNISRYPLQWPNRARTPAGRRQRPKFTSPSFAAARDGLIAELRRLGAWGVVLSTNVELRQDGWPYAGRRQPDDPGVAVYFVRKSRDLCLACDRWVKVEDNLRAITDAIECIRMIERRGTGDMVDAAFTGFAALPPAGPAWHEVLGLSHQAGADDVRQAVRREMGCRHPDRGGSAEAWTELQRAIAQMPEELRSNV